MLVLAMGCRDGETEGEGGAVGEPVAIAGKDVYARSIAGDAPERVGDEDGDESEPESRLDSVFERPSIRFATPPPPLVGVPGPARGEAAKSCESASGLDGDRERVGTGGGSSCTGVALRRLVVSDVRLRFCGVVDVALSL